VSKIVLYILVVLIVFSSIALSEETEAPFVLGIISEVDGTAIQLYYERETTQGIVEVYIPQKTDSCPYDEFWIWLDTRDGNNHTVVLKAYEVVTRMVVSYNNISGELEYANITEFTKKVSEVNFTLRSGMNEAGDYRYAEMLVSDRNWNLLEPEDKKYKIYVYYNELVIPFFKHTDFSLVKVTETRFDRNAFVYQQIIFLAASIVLAVVAGSIVSLKIGQTFPNIPISALLLGVSWFVIGVLLTTIGRGAEVDDPFRELVVFPPEYASIFLAFLMFFFIPAQFRSKKLPVSLIIALHVPFLDRTSVMKAVQQKNPNQSVVYDSAYKASGKWTELYSYIDKEGKRHFTKDPDGFFDFVSRLLFGGIKLNFRQTFVVPHNNKRDEIIFCINYEDKFSAIIDPKLHALIYFLLMAGFVACGFLSLTFIPVLGFLSAACAVLLLGFAIWVRIEQKNQLDFQPLSRNAMAAMYSAGVVQEIEGSLNELMLENEELRMERHTAFFRKLGEFLIRWEKRLFRDNYMKHYKDLGEKIEQEQDKSRKMSKREMYARLRDRRKLDQGEKDSDPI
jgi:hypothetical protein